MHLKVLFVHNILANSIQYFKDLYFLSFEIFGHTSFSIHPLLASMKNHLLFGFAPSSVTSQAWVTRGNDKQSFICNGNNTAITF